MDGVERVKIEVSVQKGQDIRPIGCDVPLGQVSERKEKRKRRRRKENKTKEKKEKNNKKKKN